MMNIDKTKYTPMMRQYLEIKENHMDCILFFRLGDFYEMFFNDALIVSRELEIALTARSAGAEEKVPMCGVPHHSASGYIEKLAERGYKVAICEQVEEATDGKGIVKRDVVKIITPGTNLDFLEEKSNNYLVAVSQFTHNFSLAYTDLSTGEIFATTIERDIDVLASELLSLNAKEIIVDTKFKSDYIQNLANVYAIVVSHENETYIPMHMRNLVEDVNNEQELDVLGRLLNYVIRTQKRELMHLQKVQEFKLSDYLRVDIHSSRNLELIETLRSGSKKGTLFWLLDKCQTAMGSRNLKKWIRRPSVDAFEIETRLSFVEEFTKSYLVHEEIKESLKSVYDLERIIGRISYGSVNAKDLVQLRRSLSSIPRIKAEVAKLNADVAIQFAEQIESFTDLQDVLDRALIDNPPLTIKEGGIIKDGYFKELDDLRYIANNGKEWLLELEQQERERTGINNLKIGYNKIFGYFIEVRTTHLEKIDTEKLGYVRKQTLANVERYVSDALKEKESLILGSEDKIIKIEYELFQELRELCKQYIARLQVLANQVSYIDTISTFADVANENRYVRPIFVENYLTITNGRHPVIEKVSQQTFVSNNTHLTDERKVLLVTGPNMSGKSTYMRQLALTIIMAQMGCFVPADECYLPIYDQIFTRIGSADDLVSGKSTFMVEMLEANNAIANATAKSLILFDEIGRGTSTYDGMAIAQAIVEYVHEKIDCHMLFSTHYHELTELESSLRNLKNIHVAAEERNNEVIFLHKIKEGPASDSFGINVASLANLPKSLINRASKILKQLENKGNNVEFNLFNVPVFEEEIILPQLETYSFLKEAVENLDLNNITPMEALIKLSKLKEMI